MAANKTSISLAATVREALLASEDVAAITSCVYPVLKARAEMPYVFFRRSGGGGVAAKGAQPDAVSLDVICVCADYDQSVELAEAVRAAIEGARGAQAEGGCRLSWARLEDASEDYAGDAFVQLLAFSVRV